MVSGTGLPHPPSHLWGSNVQSELADALQNGDYDDDNRQQSGPSHGRIINVLLS